VADENFHSRTAYGPVAHAGESIADYRTRMEIVQAEALERWQQQLHEQSSTLNSASDRIRIWERRHQIDLPRNPSHRLLAIIAENTGLSLEEVRAEQQLRASTPPTAPAVITL
jgi:hypothetical protein